jgi:hypothetical protein
MDLDLDADQRMLLSGIEPLLARYRRLPDPATAVYFSYGETLQSELEQAGFYGEGAAGGLGLAEAALLLDQIAQSPYAVPAMAPLIVAPLLAPVAVPGPIALVSSSKPVPVRFLGQARTALIDAGSEILMLDLAAATLTPVTTIFAYPYAVLSAFERSSAVPLEVDPEAFRDRWRLGLTLEILGAMRASLAITVDYTKQREQFKRPIGSFQAVQHRLGEDATRVEAISLLASRAAWSGSAADIAVAASYAQQAINQLVYDCHQFHGAMGLTLEYVLHHWTYRLKILAGELGGSAAQGRRAADAIWDQQAA